MPPPAPKKCGEVPVPRQISQHQRLFENIYPQATPTDLGPQVDVRDTNPMDMAQFTDLNLGGAPTNPFILDRTHRGIATNMYPEATRPSFVPNTLVETTERADATPLARPSTKTMQAKDKEIYDRYIEE